MIERGIYGGTFAPIHLGHIRAANAFYDEVGLDELFVIPTFLPPHKAAGKNDNPQDRLAMARLSFDDNPRRIHVSDYEIGCGGTSYTYKTLQHFSAPGVRLTFLCGTDMFLTLDSWREPSVIFSLARIAHAKRAELPPEVEAQVAERTAYFRKTYGAEILHLIQPPCELSSTEIRDRCRLGLDISALVTPQVHDYIAAHRLYGNPAAGGLS